MQTLTTAQLAWLKQGGEAKPVMTVIPQEGSSFVIDGEDIVENSFSLSRSSAFGQAIEIGSANIAELRFDAFKTEKFEGVQLEGATIELAFDIAGQTIPGGVFVVDERPAMGDIVRITALDNLVKFNRPYVSETPYPRTLEAILDESCQLCGVTNGVGSFPNMGLSIRKRPETSLMTHHQMIGWIAAMAGKNAYADENGVLRFGWYDSTSAMSLTMSDYFEVEFAESDRQITGVSALGRTGSRIQVGTEEYVIDLTGNPFLEDDVESSLLTILGQVNTVTWRPMTRLDAVALPHLWPGDRLLVETGEGVVATIVTGHHFQTASTLSAAGESAVRSGYARLPAFSAAEQQEIIDVIRARKIVADSVLVPSADETLDETLIKIQRGEIELKGVIAKGGENLLRNPSFGTIKLAEKDGWSTGYLMSLLEARFRGQTMAQMLVTLQGKTVADLINYNY